MKNVLGIKTAGDTAFFAYAPEGYFPGGKPVTCAPDLESMNMLPYICRRAFANG